MKSVNYSLDEQKKVIKINDLSKVTPKKISGTNFAGVIGCDEWKTPFQIWCEIMKIYKKPFVENEFVTAGKIIEPKQAKYIKDKYNLEGLISPVDKYGENYFKKTRGDFFPLDIHFQGMWDYLNIDLKTGKVSSVIECKTAQSKNKVVWEKAIPTNYLLQAGLYAYLLGVDRVVMPATFLEAEDYAHPEDFVVNDENTKLYHFIMSEKMPKFEEYYVKPAILWWNKYVVGGVSPEWDEFNAGDAEIIRELKTACESEQLNIFGSEDNNKTTYLKDVKCDDQFF